jgi:hypothetical protein
MRTTMRNRRTGANRRAAGVLLACGAAFSPLAWSPAVVTAAANPTQAELDRVMALQPGGVQVSDNAVVWGDGDVVLVVPDPGQPTAPEGLGKNIRADALTSPAMRALATVDQTDGAARIGATHGCPGGLLTRDYYCFYQFRDWRGRRVQFTGATATGDAEEWGFNNGTTSWVSNDVDCTVKAYNTSRSRNPMWEQPENSVSSYVGAQHDNKMSYWTC